MTHLLGTSTLPLDLFLSCAQIPRRSGGRLWRLRSHVHHLPRGHARRETVRARVPACLRMYAYFHSIRHAHGPVVAYVKYGAASE